MKLIPRIEVDTPIILHAIATGVIEEAGVWLDAPLPQRWIRELTARANTVYARNERFRRQVRGQGNRGRDYLWMFMRHWLAGLLHARRPYLHARLPVSYNIGQPLPSRPTVAVHRHRQMRKNAPLFTTLSSKSDRRTVPRVRPRLRPAPDYAWAAAAHFHVA